jgi:DNA-directed RNA polymerase specialized sigma24 family protein
MQTTTRQNRLDSNPDEINLIRSEPISMQWTDELRRNISIHPSCKLLKELLSLDLYTRTVVYPFLIKGWSPRRIADRFKVSLITIQKLLELGREQLKRRLAAPRPDQNQGPTGKSPSAFT